MRSYALVLGSFVLAASATSCANPGKPGGGTTPYPAVSPLAAGVLPNWIVEISPKGTAQAGAQVRVRFKNDVIPLDVLESPDRQAALAHFSLTPTLPGRFLFLTPRMAGFEADAPIPNATRVRVTVSAGLADLKGNTLSSDVSWTFQTQPIALSGLPGSDVSGESLEPVGLRPSFSLWANTELDENSLVAHTALLDDSNPKATPVDVSLVRNASPSPTHPGDASGANQEQSYYYAFRPNGDLAGAKTYRIVVGSGVAPLHGNLPTKSSAQGKLRTYGPLAFNGVSASGGPDQGGDGRFASGSPVLNFSNGLDAASAQKAVTVSPSPNPGVVLLGVADGDQGIRINPYALNPRTHYTLSVATALKDQFGQNLAQPASGAFDTSDFVADIWAPSGLNVFPSDANLQLNVETTNLPDARYRSVFRVVQPQDLIANDEGNALAFLPTSSGWPWQASPKRPNTAIETPVALREKLGGATGMLAYGVNARTIHTSRGWQNPTYGGVVQLTDIGIFAQWFPNGGIVRTAHLSDGRPLAGAKVEIFESFSDRYGRQKQNSTTVPCASGTTDATGSLTLDSGTFARCASTAPDSQTAPSLLVVAHNGADWAFVRTDSYSGAYGAGMYGGWSAGSPDPHGTIVSDRTLYQPGETAQFVVVAYFDENGALVRGRATSYTVSIQSPSGKNTSLGVRSLDAFGSFSIAYPISKRAEVGYYQINASASNGEALAGSFRVAEFKPPNFKVDLALDAQRVMSGTTVNAKATSTYLFGAPVEGGKSHYYVTRQQSYYTPAGWEQYDFGRSWFYPEQPPSVDVDVLQKDLTLGSDGTSSIPVPVATDLPYPMDYRVDSETTDVSNLSVADSKTFTAFPSDAIVGLHGDFVATAGEPFKIDAVVLGLDGKPRTDKKLKLVLQERIFNSATQVVEGSETPRDSVHYTDIATLEVSPGTSPATATFTAPKPGSYRVRANFSGSSNDATATDHDLWVSGAGEFSWGNDQQLTVKLDKKTYRPGDTATALIQSPYADADLFFAIVRHDVLYRKVLSVHGPAPQVRFRVTPEMLPNAAVEAVLVRRGKPLAQGVPAGLDKHKLARAGFATFEVALDAKYLKLDIRPGVAQPQPGTKQHLSIRLTDRKGQPASGELVLAVVNDAVLQLTGYRFPDLVKIVYADQPISTRFADNRALVTLLTEHKYVNKGFGFGGGLSASPGSTRVRTNFQPIAYWNGALRTDASGNASVDFQLPDDLTTWRVMVIAMTADARFGNGETTFIATKPLVTNPIVPQFSRPGDTFSLGVSVTNIGKATGDVALQASLSGGLTFADGSQSKQLQGATQGLVSAYRFDVAASGTGDANVKVVTKLGANADAFAVPLQLRTNDTLETVATTGATTTSASVPLDVPQSPLGGLELTLASTMLAELGGPQQLLKFDRAPFATSIASRIAIAADTIMLDRQSGVTVAIPALQKTLLADLDALETQALPDGGYAPWPGAKHGDIWSTAFVATQLQQAHLAGYNPSGIAHAERFLNAVLADPSDGCALSTDLCRAENRLEALETLGTLGQPRSDYLSDIWALHEKFAYVEQVELARHLLKVSGWHDQGIALRDKLLEQVYETARNAAVNAPFGFETGVAEQSQILGLMLDSHLSVDRVDKAVTSLLGRRGRDGYWPWLGDDAEALNALVAYAQGAGKPGTFTADLTIGALSDHAAFAGSSNTLHTFTHALGGAKGVPPGKTSANLSKHGDGTLHYAVALRYRPPDVSAGVYSGIRIDRRLHPVNDPTIIAAFGLAPIAADATHVAANRVFEVEDRVTTDHSLDDAIITDPLPAGFEAVDTGFRTATPYFQAHSDNWQIDYQAIYNDRVIAFAHYLPAGVYAVHYLVRSVTPGSFLWPGATVSLEYAPEEFGRTTSTRLTIDQAK